MAFERETGAAFVLVALTLICQSAGMALLIHWGRLHLLPQTGKIGPVRSALLMVRFTGLIVALHLLQILLWAWFYRWKCFPSWETAFYFSTTSYSTVGADLIPPHTWRTLGPVESVTGVLMCGLSASFLFAVVTRLVERAGKL